MTNLEQLTRTIRAHRISYADGHGTAKCSCGHHYGKLTDTRRAHHIAQAIIDAGWTGPVEPVPFDADCWTCAKEIADKHRAKGDFATSLSFRMYLCPNCGNKRCPKATNHRAKCTGSNKPNQIPYLDN